MLIVTAAEMRELDRKTIELGTPGWTLMQHAGEGATRVLFEVFAKRRRKRVVVVCGRGNNGGDGFVIARGLRKAEVAVEVFLVGRADQVRGDAALAMRSWSRARGKLEEVHSAADVARLQQRLAGAAWVVDALFGTGLKGDVTGLAAEIIASINGCGASVFAVDMPSGLDADLGVPLGVAVQAEVTATFALPKIGQVIHPGVEHCGRLAVVDIGIPAEAIRAVAPRAILLDDDEIAAVVPRRAPAAHKGDAGHVLVLAGSRGKTGAALLAAGAAGRGGAGLVTAAVPESQQPIVAAGLLEAMSTVLADAEGELAFDERGLAAVLGGKTTVVCGPGIGTGAGARATVAWLLRHGSAPLVLDADGLNCAADMLHAPATRGILAGAAAGGLVLTPHPGEMARLTGRSTAEVQADRVGVARAFAAEHRCVLVLKGARTIVAAPDGRLAINPTGNPGMASGGMGDVLAGFTGALLAQNLPPYEAACAGVYLHGFAADLAAGERGTIGLLARDVIDYLPRAMRELEMRGPGHQ